MKSSKYWEDVALLREIAVQDGVTTSAEDILKLYDEALDDINSEIKKIKANFMRRFGLDNETATYFLEAAQEEENLQMLIDALEIAPNEKAREDILTYIHLDGLSVRAYAARTERHEAVKKSIYARIKKLAAEETRLMTGMLKSAYKESYYGLIDDAAKGFDVGINFALLDDDAIEEAIKTKWHGKRFSERIWKNTDRLAEEAQSLVTKALMSGESLTKTAQKLADSFEVEKYHATTLVRTETAHAHAMADLKGYEDLGIEEYKYLATLDYLTCTLCQPLDGMVFKVSEAREGVNYPTLHPRCRCTTTVTGDFDKRSARNPITGKSELIDGNTTYTEWVKNMTPEQRQALELAKRKNERRTSDKLQHEKYKKLLGTKNVPKSFDKFQDLKYNNSELWDDLRKCYREVSWQKECQKIYEKATLHRMPDNSVPNSVIDNYSSSGTILQRRYFGRTGKPRLDIDMTDHGNAKQHPVVPHYHDWFELQSGKVQRSLEHDKALELWHKIANKDILE